MDNNTEINNIQQKLCKQEYKLTLWDRITIPICRFYIFHIKEYFLKRKYKKQRAKRGYADEDLFDISNWFGTTFVNMLQDFQCNLIGYTGEHIPELDNLDYKWKLETYKVIIDEIYDQDKFRTLQGIFEEYPIDDPYIEWRLILKRIIYCLKESCKDFTEEENENFNKYEELYQLQCKLRQEGGKLGPKTVKAMNEYKEKWLKDMDEQNKHINQMSIEAFTLLGKYFHHLWD